MGRSKNEIINELLTTDPTQRQLALLVELLGALDGDSKRAPVKSLDPNWKPLPEHFQWAQAKGKGEQWVWSIAEDMRNWAASRGERRASWNGTFTTFMK